MYLVSVDTRRCNEDSSAMGKASELDDWLERQGPLTPEETDERDPRPRLRLGHKVLSTALGPDQHMQHVLDRVSGTASDESVVGLCDDQSNVRAVAVPVEQYLELVTSYIRDRNLSELTLDNRSVPSDATLAELGVEQVDPHATWLNLGDTLS